MNAFWSYFWPPIALGIAIGLIGGLLAFRLQGQERGSRIAMAVAVAVVSALVWHGPLGAGEAFAARVERSVRATTVFYEIPQVRGRLERSPISRHVLLSGPANDFQRRELVPLMNQLPGVAATSWSSGNRRIPLLVEAAAGALAGFLCGLLVAYLLDLRRLRKSQRKW